MNSHKRDAPVRVVIGSIGRRVYLIDWFEQAFALLGVRGEVHVTDADAYSPGFLRSEFTHRMPRYEDPEYPHSMRRLFAELKPDLFFSVNDYELEFIARTSLGAELEKETGATVLTLDHERHAIFHDKYRMYNAFISAGISTPETVLVADSDNLTALLNRYGSLIIKDRYGSGSSGVHRVSMRSLDAVMDWLRSADANEKNTKINPFERYVAQPQLTGDEYGIDIVAPFSPNLGSPHILARQKVRMRAGETDLAITVRPEDFLEIGTAIHSLSKHRGTIDVDLICDHTGAQQVIDVNPRFGGGYPFSHYAGANIPLYYVQQLVEVEHASGTDALRYQADVIGAKYSAMVGKG